MERSKILGIILVTAATAFLVPWDASLWFRILLTFGMTSGVFLISN